MQICTFLPVIFLLLQHCRSSPDCSSGCVQAPAPIDAAELYRQFATNRDSARAAYFDKQVLICGTIDHLVKGTNGVKVVFRVTGAEDAVVCELLSSQDTAADRLRQGQQACLQGICAGLLLDVYVNHCIITHQ